MARFRAVAVDSPDGRAAIDGYFAERADGWPGPGVYSPKHPDPAAFTGDAGVFVLLEVETPDGAWTLAGCGGIRRLPSPDAGGDRFEVKHLWVLPAHRGAGHGRALFDELERRARGFGATELVLDTNDSLEAAGALYRRSGYVEVEPYNDNPNATTWFRKGL